MPLCVPLLNLWPWPARYGTVKIEHTAEPVECIDKVNGEALQQHLFSKGNYPDNIWPVVWPWEGSELAFLCAV